MQKDQNFSIFNISDEESARFRRIVLDVMTKSCALSDGEDEYSGIGRLGEKQMHAAIKRYICPDESFHEVKIDTGDTIADNSPAEDGKKRKARKFVADILKGGTIYEIQTGSFSPLKAKIKWILENTDYNVVLIHPIAEQKWISTISRDGKIGHRKKSPKKESIRDVASELYFISEFISSPRFSLVILMVEGEQYRKNIAKEGARPRYRKYELIPTSLLRAHIFKSIEDYRVFIPDTLPELFTVKEYSKHSNIHGIDAYSIVKTLCALGLLEQSGNIGRAAAYKICNFY